MKKKYLIFAVIAALCMMLAAGCSNGGQQSNKPAEEPAPASEPAPATEPAPSDNTAAAGSQEIIVASFGTSFDDSREVTIGAVEKAIGAALPDWKVQRAFTAQTIVDILNEKGEKTLNFKEALDDAAANGVKVLVVQPTHLMAGDEYKDLQAELEGYKGKFEKVALGNNLLAEASDFDVVADAMIEVSKEYDNPETAIVWMGHGTPAAEDGTEAESNQVYVELQKVLNDKGHDNYYIGTVEAAPSLDDVMKAMEGKGYKKVVLRPLMVVAGDHANNDMADEKDPESWASTFKAAGYDVTSVIEGLGQIPAIQDLYAKHAQDAVASLGA